MSFFNANITGSGGSAGAAGGLVTKFEKSVSIGNEETAEIQISLKDDISNYADITDEQIIVDITNVGASGAGTANLTQSYDAEQGVITITSDSSKIPFIVDSTVEVIVYVAGAVQLPPAPVSTVNSLYLCSTDGVAMPLGDEYVSEFLDEVTIKGSEITGVAKLKMVGKNMYVLAQNDGQGKFSVNGIEYTPDTIALAKIDVGDTVRITSKKATTSQSNAGRVYVLLGVLE